MSYALRPWQFFVGQLLAAVSMPQSAAFPSGLDNPTGRVTLGPLFHDELEFWWWFVDTGLIIGGALFIAHVQHHHPPTKN